MAKVVKVNKLPDCDLCGVAASYDGKTIYGPWANMCDKCFKKYGVGLGTGRGQKLELNERQIKPNKTNV